jgi:hypothetical protein
LMDKLMEIDLPDGCYWVGRVFTVNGHRYKVIGFEDGRGRVSKDGDGIPVLEELEVVNFT